jgi:FtsP/CotA-like multicopper oxidase with cupredoxin domain
MADPHNGMTRRQLFGVAALPLLAQPFSALAAQPDLVASRRIFKLPSGHYAQGLGFSAGFAQPLVHAEADVTRALRVRNGLDQPFRLRWMGVRGMMAESMPMIAPHSEQEISFTCPDPGIYAYRAEDGTGGNTLGGQGLCGALVVGGGDDAMIALGHMRVGYAPLPRLMAPHEAQGFGFTRWPFAHVHAPVKAVADGSRVRVHVVNVGTDSAVAVRFEAAAVRIIAVDGQPCPAFEPFENRIVLPPHGRISVEVEIANQGLRVLDEMNNDNLLMDIGFSETAKQVWVDDAPEANPALPGPIPLENAMRASWEIGTSGVAPGVKVRAGQSVMLGFHNTTDVPYGVHLQGHSARLLDSLDDGWKPWWHDSLFVPPGKTMRLVFKAGSTGNYHVSAVALGEVKKPDFNAVLRVS